MVAVNVALPDGQKPFTRDSLVRAVRLLAEEGLAEQGWLGPGRRTGRRSDQSSMQAAEVVGRYLRSHRREAAECGVAVDRYLGDRLHVPGAMPIPPLPDLVRQAAAPA
jgi:hypothetical protein